MNIRTLTCIALSVATLPVVAQSADSNTAKAGIKLPSIALGAGVLYFNGDIGKGVGVTPYGTIRTGYNFTVEERLLPYLGVSLTALYGKLSASERSLDTARNLNFESKIIQGDFLINFHFDGSLFKSDAPVSPFVYAGISYLSFNPYSDLKDANGNPYHYWTDGTMRNMPQTDNDLFIAKTDTRNYTYETPLDSGKYAKYSFSIPVGAGIKLRITDKFFVNIQATYYLTFSPHIDNYSLSGQNDKYLYSFFTLEYHFRKKEPEDPKYAGIDFRSLIKDTIKVGRVKKEAPVSDSAITAQYFRDTLSESRSQLFNENPSMQALQSEDSVFLKKARQTNAPAHTLPAKFKWADKNGDGYISSQEITEAINDFFDGTAKITIADINALIDYFFDQ